MENCLVFLGIMLCAVIGAIALIVTGHWLVLLFIVLCVVAFFGIMRALFD